MDALLKLKSNARRGARRLQRGGVAIMFGLTVIVLVAFAGLVIDLGRFFVIKAELQNAMDACALSAATQLRPGLNDPNALTRAIAYGRVFTTGGVPPLDAVINKANFQSVPASISTTQVTFSPTLNGSYDPFPPADPNTASYVKCESPLKDLRIYLMRVLNLVGADFSTQTVSAMAVATRGPQVCNPIPAGICEKASTPTHGLTLGEWFPVGEKLAPGFFGWVDFSAPGGGAGEVKDGLTADGTCPLPVVGNPAYENGKKSSVEDAWNTRFGIYSNLYSTADAPPDKTGYAYFGQTVGSGANQLVANWPRTDIAGTPRAYDGINGSTPNYGTATAQIRPYEQTTTIFSGPTTITNSADLNTSGKLGRRLLVVPVLDCSVKPAIIRDIACVLMLNPFGKVTGGGASVDINGKLEYLGLLSGSTPCGPLASGPLMSALVK